ncbi:heterokaryon incompatibility protein-domain-containing protein, partial [Hyaloscypha sp. PMI_1271]
RKLPTRVIDIGEDSGEPRLLITSGQEARYVAFSYQWGDPLLSPPPLKTTKEKLKGYLSAIPTADLPRSFIDLIEITRAIGERYIWIDSLCIVQDDEQDWEREALQMGSVFLNAFLTVVAASITSPHQSFLASRNLWPLVEVPVIPAGDESVEIGRFYISPGLTSTSAKFHHTEKFVSDVGFTEWNKRGWTFQERELSRRILYFGKTQLHFACNEGRWEEELGLAQHSVSREEHRSSHDDLVCEDINKMWYKLASDYSSRLLTYEIDRLPAISGLARHLERAYAESSSNPPRRYLSGLWDDDLVPGLMWYVDKGKIWKARSSAKPYLGPSWSWISHLGGVEWHTDPKYTQACEIVNANMGYATGDPMGRVTSGYLTIRGKL